MALSNSIGKFTGKLVRSTKAAPAKTKGVVSSMKKNFTDGYNDTLVSQK